MVRISQAAEEASGCGRSVITKEGLTTLYRISDAAGDAQLREHPVYPGITLMYKDIHRRECADPAEYSGVFYEIRHCREGRMECSGSGNFFYIAPGDLAVIRRSGSGGLSFFPFGHFHGLSLYIDAQTAPRCLPCILDEAQVNPAEVVDRLCGASGVFVLHSEPRLTHVFEELYRVPPELQRGYFKLKVLEILLFLGGIQPQSERTPHYSAAQVEITKRVCAYLSENMDRRTSIEMLAKMFHLSATQLKISFKGVYGVPLYAFIRAQKIEAAARDLLSTNRTVLDIASAYGYDNASKFAKAFRDIMGVSPCEYRKRKK